MIFKGFGALLILLPSLIVSHSVAAAPAIPDTPAGRQWAALTETVNSGDEVQVRAFVTAHFSPAALREQPAGAIVRSLTSVYRWTHGLEWDAVYPQSDTYIGGFAWAKQGVYARSGGRRVFVRLEVLGKAPFLINRYEFQPEEAPLESLFPRPRPGATEAERINGIAEAAARAAAQDRLSGVVLVARNGRVLLSQAYGEADKASHTPNRPDTRFPLASVGKLFTTVAVAQLAAQGKLDYGAPIRRYLPDYPNPAVADKVTLRHLLTHTSGLGDIFGPGKDDPRRHFHRLSEYLPLFAQEPLLFEPGKGDSYSNAGFLVLSLIVERVSGQTFGDYLRMHVFRPAGMDGPDYAPSGPRRAEGYMRDSSDDPLNPAAPLKNSASFYAAMGTGPVNGAGGGYTTARDLSRFADALLSHRLLDMAALDAVVKNGYGFEVGTANGRRKFGHTGAGPGENASLFLCPDQGYTVVVLSNYGPPFAQVFGERIGDVLTSP